MSDEQARFDAVDPERSVIVQAPAGSGKTTLLVERYLGLLTVVEAPEEILAITFTRKAAAEMKHRILRYLDPAFDSSEPHEQQPLAKARAVRDKVSAWGLLQNPQRLLIRTIDSFNHFLARTMPVASALGPVPTPADDTQSLYRQAARSVLALLDRPEPLADDVALLLEWRDHRGQDIEDLLAGLLAKREQWLRALAVAGPPDRSQFEAVLRALVESRLRAAEAELQRALAPLPHGAGELLDLLQYAGRTVIGQGGDSVVAAFADAEALPTAHADALRGWAGLAEALLTAKGEFRQRITIAEGFPPKSTEKARFMALLDALRHDQRLAAGLHGARALPSPRYREDEWSVLQALITVLRRAAVELELIFARTGQSDFTGLGQAALRGLGNEDQGYTDLGLYLDRRIRHILVDEFQDTNWAQLHLLEKLTAGWEPHDGRTLFLVGDPMQSIYRFREAEVGLFMRSRAHGIGLVELEPLRLSRNFRSRAEIVRWVNERIGPNFPAREEVSAGAVTYAPSEPGRDTGGTVELHALPGEAAEAEAIADLLADAISERATDPKFKAAIIVRARSHLRAILPALARRGIPYRAVKLDPLASRPVVQDLLALTRVIVLPADRAALLAVLRAPVCGLTLEDLHALSGDGQSPFEPAALARLTPDGRRRAEPVFAALADARRAWRRRPVRDLVEGVWRRLGGPECSLHPVADMNEAGAYLQALTRAEADGILDDWNDFTERLTGLHTEGDPPSESVRLEILTMHGAKGLEWDLVVLPGLNRRPNGTDHRLLHWLPFADADGTERVLLAPLRSAEEESDVELVKLIRSEQQARERYESQRLLYVAATRARERLVLSASLEADAKGNVRPATGSLLADLWSTTEQGFLDSLAAAPPQRAAVSSIFVHDQSLRRVASGWAPDLGPRLAWQPALPPRERNVEVEFFWAGIDARRSGTVLHRLLERAGRLGIENLTAALRGRLADRIPVLLQAMGSRGEALERTAAAVRDAFEQTLDSEPGRWLLSNRHSQAACELPVAGVLDGQLVNAVIDRTFVDDQGVRWIIDYKSGYHAGADLEAFLVQEAERYREQLGRYRRLFELLGEQRITTALFLPRHARLHMVDA